MIAAGLLIPQDEALGEFLSKISAVKTGLLRSPLILSQSKISWLSRTADSEPWEMTLSNMAGECLFAFEKPEKNVDDLFCPDLWPQWINLSGRGPPGHWPYSPREE